MSEKKKTADIAAPAKRIHARTVREYLTLATGMNFDHGEENREERYNHITFEEAAKLLDTERAKQNGGLAGFLRFLSGIQDRDNLGAILSLKPGAKVEYSGPSIGIFTNNCTYTLTGPPRIAMSTGAITLPIECYMENGGKGVDASYAFFKPRHSTSVAVQSKPIVAKGATVKPAAKK